MTQLFGRETDFQNISLLSNDALMMDGTDHVQPNAASRPTPGGSWVPDGPPPSPSAAAHQHPERSKQHPTQGTRKTALPGAQEELFQVPLRCAARPPFEVRCPPHL